MACSHFKLSSYDFDGIGGINAEDMLIGERLGDLIRSGAFPDSRTFQGVDINNDGKVNDSDLTLFGLSLTDAIDLSSNGRFDEADTSLLATMLRFTGGRPIVISELLLSDLDGNGRVNQVDVDLFQTAPQYDVDVRRH